MSPVDSLSFSQSPLASLSLSQSSPAAIAPPGLLFAELAPVAAIVGGVLGQEVSIDLVIFLHLAVNQDCLLEVG